MITPDLTPAATARPTDAVFRAHLPKTLDLAAVTTPDLRAYAAWVVSAVIIQRYIDRSADEVTFVPLGSDYIDRHIPALKRPPVLKSLLEAGVLECDNVYYFNPFNPGSGKCLCYRVGPAYRGVGVRCEAVDHRELVRKVSVARRKEREDVTDPVHVALRAWHDQVEVLPTARLGEHPLLDRMLDGERRFTVCQQGRVHTNVANLPAQCRRHIRLAGRELASVDICTSQPLILALLLTGDAKPKRRAPGADPLASLHHSSNSSLNVFLGDCLSGVVYDRVADETGRYTRDEVKPKFLAVIYGEPKYMHTVVGEAIGRLYPAVFEAVVELNYQLGHGGLPRLMQTIESRVMIGRVAGRLVREHPDLPLLTVHDAVVIPPEAVPLVKQVVTEEWTAAFGLSPRTKATSFTAPQEVRPRKRRRRRKKCRTGGWAGRPGRGPVGSGGPRVHRKGRDARLAVKLRKSRKVPEDASEHEHPGIDLPPPTQLLQSVL